MYQCSYLYLPIKLPLHSATQLLLHGLGSEVAWELAAARLLQEYEEQREYETKRSVPVKHIEGSSHGLTAQNNMSQEKELSQGRSFIGKITEGAIVAVSVAI